MMDGWVHPLAHTVTDLVAPSSPHLCCLLVAVFSLPLRQVKAMCCNYPFILVTRPAHIASKCDLWADMLQVDRSDVVSVVVVSLINMNKIYLNKKENEFI